MISRETKDLLDQINIDSISGGEEHFKMLNEFLEMTGANPAPEEWRPIAKKLLEDCYNINKSITAIYEAKLEDPEVIEEIAKRTAAQLNTDVLFFWNLIDEANNANNLEITLITVAVNTLKEQGY